MRARVRYHHRTTTRSRHRSCQRDPEKLQTFWVDHAIERSPASYADGSGSRVAPMEIGLYTFGELTPHWADGRRMSAEQRLKEILAAAKLADAAGFAVFALGEHHRL